MRVRSAADNGIDIFKKPLWRSDFLCLRLLLGDTFVSSEGCYTTTSECSWAIQGQGNNYTAALLYLRGSAT